MTRVAPSILAADFSDLWNEIQPFQSIELLHLDVMDGHFVPNISFGLPVIASLRQRTDLYFDTHLMIERPSRYLDAFADAGADRITVHPESCDEIEPVIDEIHARGLDAGIALNPTTSIDSVSHLVDDVEVVLVMSVEPGFGGQEFKPSTIDRIETLDSMTDTEIAVDGGVGPETAPSCAAAGADTLVAGSAIFGKPDVQEAVEELLDSVAEA